MEEDRKTYTPPAIGKYFVAGWIAAVIAVVVLTAGLVLARELWLRRQSSELEQEYQHGRRVLVTHVMHGPRAREIKLPATIHGYTETPIYAKVSGYLKQIAVDKGDRVKEGQVLAILESPELDHQVEDARASYHLQQLTDRRNQMLLRSGVSSQQAADESHAALLQARAKFDQLVATQAYETIKAPFAGLITARYVDPGALIPQSTTPSAGGTPIVAMATMTPLRIYADMPQSFAPFIKDGDRAKLTVAEFPQRVFEGAVTRHSDALNADTRTMRVEVDLENRDLVLLPGMYATVDFAVALPSGVPMVPDDALVFRGEKVYVPVVRQHRMHLAEATLGYDNGVAVEVTNGVTDDDVVAISVGQSAREGEIVQPVLEDAQRGNSH